MTKKQIEKQSQTKNQISKDLSPSQIIKKDKKSSKGLQVKPIQLDSDHQDHQGSPDSQDSFNFQHLTQAKINIFIGLTGSGKSSTINQLIGNQPSKYQQKEGNQFLLHQRQKNDKYPQISNLSVSCSQSPKIYKDDEQKMVCMDTPGFMSTKGAQAQIRETFLTIKAINLCIQNNAPLRIVYVVDYNQITAYRGSTFVIQLNKLAQIFRANIAQLKTGLVIFVTKVNLNFKINKKCIQNKVKQIIQSNANISKQCIELFGDIKQEQIFISPFPNQLTLQGFRQLKQQFCSNRLPYVKFSEKVNLRFSALTEDSIKSSININLKNIQEQLKNYETTIDTYFKHSHQTVTSTFKGIQNVFDTNRNQATYGDNWQVMQDQGQQFINYAKYTLQQLGLKQQNILLRLKEIKFKVQILKQEYFQSSQLIQILLSKQFFSKYAISTEENEQFYIILLKIIIYKGYIKKYARDLDLSSTFQSNPFLQLSNSLKNHQYQIAQNSEALKQMYSTGQTIINYYRDNIKRKHRQYIEKAQMQQQQEYRRNMMEAEHFINMLLLRSQRHLN